MDAVRQEVSYDEVSAAATSLQDDGEAVTIEAVRDAIGFGSVIEIHKHLARWRSTYAKPAAELVLDLPQPIAAALGDWARQIAEEASAPLREALARAESDIETLLNSADELATQRAELAEEMETTTAARDDALALVEERNDEIERLTAELRDARKVATDALVGKAKDQLAIEGKDAQLAELRAQVERSVAAQASESDARLAAQMELVGAVTARDNFAAEIKELRAQLDAANAERGIFRTRSK